ncbi:unnamed protein product, partial [Larinioides sclopetarius]
LRNVLRNIQYGFIVSSKYQLSCVNQHSKQRNSKSRPVLIAVKT